MAKNGNSGSGGKRPRKNAPGQGRKKTPSKIQEGKGNPGRRPINTQEPDFGNVVEGPWDQQTQDQKGGQQKGRRNQQGQAKSVPVPEELEGDRVAERMWVEVMPRLARERVLQVTDMRALIGACIAWSGVMEARALLATQGYIIEEPVTDKEGDVIDYKRKRNPAAVQLEKSMGMYRSYASEMGLTPSSRASLFGGSSEADELEDYLQKASKSKS